MIKLARRKSFKRITVTALIFGVVVAGFPHAAFAGDTWPFEGDSAHGKNQPSVHGYTSSHIMNWSPETDPDAEMLRSYVPLQKRIAPFSATQANPELGSEAQMITVAGDYGNAFIENAAYTNKFAQYHFNFWQYTDYYSYWHGTATAYTPPEYYDETAQSDWQQKWFEFGILNIPNPTYTDAAHKNGVLSLAGIFFSNNDRGQQTYKQMIVKDEHGNFPVAEKLIEMANYFGFDGYFMNQEEQSPNVAVADIPDYIAFLKVLQKGGLYVQWYDSLNTATGSNTFARTFNDNNISFLYDKNDGEPVSQSYFFDYGMGSSQITGAKNYLNQLNQSNGTDIDLYDVGFAGLEAGRDRFKSVQGSALKSKLDSKGQPQLSLATLGADFVHAGLDEDMNLSYPVKHRAENEYQWMTKVREQLWWSGPNIDPQNTTVSATNTVNDVYADNRYWPGIASVISERSVIAGTNFYTNFNTGHGLSYYVNGSVSNDDEWSNMSLQDIPVTWQWWQDTVGSKLTVDFDYGAKYNTSTSRYNYSKIGGFNGGSSLVVSGDLDAENFLHLYKTDLDVIANSMASLTYNKPAADDDSSMALGLLFADNPDVVVKVPVPESGNQTDGWVTKDINLSSYAGKRIAAFGLVFDPGQSATIADYQMNVGQIRITDGSAAKLSAPGGLTITQAFADSNEMNLKWEMDSNYNQVKQYNVYVNDVFVGGKYDKVFYIKNLPAKSGVVKVVPVGTDGLEGEAATVSFDLTASVSDITADSRESGEFIVSWENAAPAFGEITVKVRSLNWITTEEPVSEQMIVPAGSTSASFTDMPINGDDYLVTVIPAGADPVSISGNFIDKVAEPYAEAWSWEGNKLNLPMPTARDWRYMYVYEDNVLKSFPTTYSVGNKDRIIRGRSTKASLSFTSNAQLVHVVMEDYAGNKSEPVYLKNYQISFDTDGGEPALNQISAAHGSKIGEPTGIAKAGYVLEGWYNGGKKWNFAEDVVTGDLTLKAHWVLEAPSFTVDLQPSKTVNEGDEVNLSVVAKGNIESLTWQTMPAGGDSWNSTTVTEDVYSFTAQAEDNGTRFRVVLRGIEGTEPREVTSTELTLTVAPAGVDIDEPEIHRVDVSSNPAVMGSQVTFSVDARANGTLGYQWYKDNTAIENAVSATYEIGRVTANDAGKYKVVVTNTIEFHGQAYTAAKESEEIDFEVSRDLAEWKQLNALLTEIDVLKNNDIYTAQSIAALKASTAYKEAKLLNADADPDVIKEAYAALLQAKNDILVRVASGGGPGNGGNGNDNGSGSSSGSGQTPDITPAPKPEDPNTLVITAHELSKSAENGRVAISVEAGVTNIELPVNAGELLGQNALQLQTDKVTLEIQSELLHQLQAAVDKDQLKDSKIRVTIAPKSLSEAGIHSSTGISLQGGAVELELSIITGTGDAHHLSGFAPQVKIAFPMNKILNADLLGIYKIAADGTPTYMGGWRNGQMMEIEIGTAGTYAILEYNVSFSDVPANHWAADAIKKLAAKHLIQGVSENEYQPNREITRAEFVKIMANALQLDAQAVLTFTDVAQDAWYREDLAKMVEAGLITGRSESSFAPNAKISRQEMATILMRAYTLEHGSAAIEYTVSFKDEAHIAAWALDNIKAAASLGLIHGRTGERFAPEDLATRAEAAQIMANYLSQ